MHKGVQDLSNLQKDVLIEHFINYMQGPERKLLAETYPQIYNTIYGKAIVKVVNVNTGEPFGQ